MPAPNLWIDLELFLTGLVMAATVCSDGPQFEDPSDDFLLWATSWDIAKPMWDHRARMSGWHAVGMCWEYHE